MKGMAMHVVSEADRARETFEHLRGLVPTMDEAQAAEAIGMTAQLDALLRSRHAALVLTAMREKRKIAQPMMGPAEAAERLHRSVNAVYRLARDGKLRAMRDGRTVRFDPADLDRYIEDRKAEA